MPSLRRRLSTLLTESPSAPSPPPPYSLTAQNLDSIAEIDPQLIPFTVCQWKGRCKTEPIPQRMFCAKHLCEFPECANPHQDRKIRSSRTCAEHQCRDCRHLVVGGSEYCQDHICRADSCVKGRRGFRSNYCEGCECPASSCRALKIVNASGCWEHKCKRPECGDLAREKYGICAFHTCRSRTGCGNERAGDGDWCNHHRCRKYGCGKHTFKKYDFCADCKCICQGCSHSRDGTLQWCRDHTCLMNGCESKRHDGSRHCIDHKCRKGACPQPRDGSDSRWCVEHRCKFDQSRCLKCQDGTSVYCVKHKCQRPGCNLRITPKSQTWSQSCQWHCCADPVCLKATLGGNDQFGYHCEAHLCPTKTGSGDTFCPRPRRYMNLPDGRRSYTSTWCLYHTCTLPDCNNTTVAPGSKVCRMHACAYSRHDASSNQCPEPGRGSQRLCTAHECRRRDCSNPCVSGGGAWCADHTCYVAGGVCKEQALFNGRWCQNHTCNRALCMAFSLGGTQVYCSAHTCQRNGCYAETRSTGQYCVQDSCKSCLSPKVGYSVFCTDHVCGFSSAAADRTWNCPEAKTRASRFCAKHVCTKAGCDKRCKSPDGGSLCADHACKFDIEAGGGEKQCLREQLGGGRYCQNHTCEQSPCLKRRKARTIFDGGDWSTLGKLCSDHACAWNEPDDGTACVAPRWRSTLCKKHTCGQSGCLFARSRRGDYCPNHTCDFGRDDSGDTCPYQAETHSSLCAAHKCKKFDCRLGRHDDNEFCGNHTHLAPQIAVE